MLLLLTLTSITQCVTKYQWLNDTKTSKSLVYYFVLSAHKSSQIGSFFWDPSAVYYRISLGGYDYVLDPFHLQIAKKLSKTTKNLNIYLYNYQTNTAIFLAKKHEKTIMTCNYLSFCKYFLHFELLAYYKRWKYLFIYLNFWYHSHKKQKESLETQVALLIFFYELEISGVAVLRVHQNCKKW